MRVDPPSLSRHRRGGGRSSWPTFAKASLGKKGWQLAVGGSRSPMTVDRKALRFAPACQQAGFTHSAYLTGSCPWRPQG